MSVLTMTKRAVQRTVRRSTPLTQPGIQEFVRYEGGLFLAGRANKIEAKLLEGHYDFANISLCRTLVQPGYVCMDIGANLGVYTVLLAKWAGEGGAVHSFEPVDHIRRRLLRHVRINGLSNVTVQAMGVGSEDTTLLMNQIREGEFREGTSTFTDNENVVSMGKEHFNRVEVPVRKLDTYTREQGFTRLDFMKIDIEGFELNCLRGATETLRRFRPIILMEHNQRRLKHLKIDERDFVQVANATRYRFYDLCDYEGKVYLSPFNFDRKLTSGNMVGLPDDF